MVRLVPAAYEVRGLVLVTLVANVFVALIYVAGAELTAARKERSIVGVTALAAPLSLLVAGTAAISGAFARPLALLAGSMATSFGYEIVRRGYYRSGRGA